MRLPALCAFLLIHGCATVPVRSTGLQRQIDETAEGGVVALGPGEWSGDLLVAKSVTLRGASEATTTLFGTVTIAAKGVRLERLQVAGSHTGVWVKAGGEAILEHVALRAAGPALRLESRAVGTVEDSSFKCADAAREASAIEVAGQLSMSRVDISGGCRRGVDLQNAVSELHRVSVHGPSEAGVHAVDSKLLLSDLAVDGVAEKGAGLFAARCQIQAANLRTVGGEEGLLLRDSQLHLDGFRAEGNRMAALALVGGKADVSAGRLVGPFREGALAALDGSQLTASGIEVRSTGLAGLFAVGAQVDVSGMQVDGPRTDTDGDYGHGFILTRSQGTLRNISVTNAEGAAVYVSNGTSSVIVDGCRARTVGAGIVASIHAHVKVGGLEVSDAVVGLFPMRGGEIEVSSSTINADTGVAGCAASPALQARKLEIKAPRSLVCGEADGGISWHKEFDQRPDWAPSRRDKELGGHPAKEKVPSDPDSHD